MKDVLFLAWRYLSYNRAKTIILTMSIALIVFLPAGLRVLVTQSARELRARAECTPLLVGAKGSPLQLVMNSLYFEADPPGPVPYAEAVAINEAGRALAVPLHVRFHAGRFRIVGTSLDYFDFRGLRVARGRQLGLLGECLLGAEAATELALEPGDPIFSSPENVFDLAGVYPLRMKVAGILAPAHSPDDRAVFVDFKTSWVIQGLGHGHQNMSESSAGSAVLREEGTNVVANASLMQYAEITRENIDSFHFHGDIGHFPLTAVLAVPPNAKSAALLMGQYQSDGLTVQILRPSQVIQQLLNTVFTVQNFVVAGLVVAGVSTLATSILVFLLSLRLRRGERITLRKIGASNRRIRAVLACEILFVLTAGILLAAALTWLAATRGTEWIRALIS